MPGTSRVGTYEEFLYPIPDIIPYPPENRSSFPIGTPGRRRILKALMKDLFPSGKIGTELFGAVAYGHHEIEFFVKKGIEPNCGCR